MNEDNKVNGTVLRFATIFIAFFVILCILGCNLSFEFVLIYSILCAFGGYMMHYKKSKGLNTYYDVVKNVRVTYLNNLKSERKTQFKTVIGVILVCIIANQWWNTAVAVKRLRLTIYASLGNVTQLCSLYNEAHKTKNIDLACEVVESLSAFREEESRAFLGKALVYSQDPIIKEKIVDSLSINDSKSFEFIIENYKNDGDALIKLCRIFSEKEATVNERNICIGRLVDKNDENTESFLDDLLLSSDDFKNVVIEAYEKSSTNTFENKIKQIEHKSLTVYGMRDRAMNILEALAGSEKYKTKVADAILSNAVANMNLTDIQHNLDMVEFIKQYIEYSSDSSEDIKDKVLSLVDEFNVVSDKYKKTIAQHSIKEKELAEAVKVLEKELSDKLAQKDDRLKQLNMFFQYVVPMYENPAYRQSLVYQFGVQGALRNIEEYSRMFWENNRELADINSEFAGLRRKITILEAGNKDKMRPYDNELNAYKIEYEGYVNKFKGFSWRNTQTEKSEWQESLNGVYLGMHISEVKKMCSEKPRFESENNIEFDGWSVDCKNGFVYRIVLGPHTYPQPKTLNGLKFDRCGLMNSIDDRMDEERLVKEGVAVRYFAVSKNGRITDYLKLNNGEVFLLDYPYITLIEKLPKGAQIDNRTF